MTVFALPPRLSVVMPVRDAGPYLDESVGSILGQTYGDFDFIIRDDGSVDGSTAKLRAWAERDRRIRLFVGDRALGPAGSSNWVVEKTTTPLVARMDADDVAHPDRLRRQLAALEADPDACLAATLWEGIDEDGNRVRHRDRWALSRTGPFAPFPHGSIMFRRRAFEEIGGYRVDCDFWEDADLYVRMARHGRLLVLPDALYLHRASRLSTRLVSPCAKVERAMDRMYRSLEGEGDPGLDADVGPILPKVYLALGSTRLWAGQPPAVLGRLWRSGGLRSDRLSLAILLWAIWSAASPRSLRVFLRSLIRLRDLAVRGRFRDGDPVAWCPIVRADACEDRSTAAGSEAERAA